MAKTKQITIYTCDEDGFTFEHVIKGRRVLNDLHPQFNFFIHEYVGPFKNKLKFTVSEESSGGCVCHEKTELACLIRARKVLRVHSYEIIKEVVDKSKSNLNEMRKKFINNPLWNAMQAVDFTATELQLADITAALKDAGYMVISTEEYQRLMDN